MNFLSYFARISRAAALCALFATSAALPVAAQDTNLAYRSADRTSGSMPTAGRGTVASGWKAMLVGGSHQIDGYNNAATDIASRLRQGGVHRVAVLHSLGAQASAGVPSAKRREIRRAFTALGGGEACLFFISSHGNDRGIYLSSERGYLSPRELSSMIDDECGNRPTVLIISGCGTGSFITSALKGDNRIILTASARGRVSYGATTTDRYVNFDRCMIKAMDAGARTWREVFDRTLPCVTERENALGVAASDPQAWFGAQVANLTVPGRI